MDRTRKYKIKEKFDGLPHSMRPLIIDRACELMGISYSHLRKIWSYKMDSVHEAKPSQLIILSDLLDCSVDELINQPLTKATLS